MLRKVLLSACAVATLFATAAPADAQMRSDRATYFTFSQPVALPRITLPAGKYLFRILDSPTTRTVVQVFNADGTKLYSMFLTIPAERSEPSDEPEVRFLETAATAPAAIATWWYPGLKTGWEFVYPKEQAILLAKASGQPVLATTSPSATVEDMKKSDLVRVTPSGETAVSETKPGSTTMAGRSQRGEIASSTAPAAQPAPATPGDPAPQPARERLPQTFGFLPLLGVIGGIALVAGVAMRSRSRASTPAPSSPPSTPSATDYHRGA